MTIDGQEVRPVPSNEELSLNLRYLTSAVADHEVRLALLENMARTAVCRVPASGPAPDERDVLRALLWAVRTESLTFSDENRWELEDDLNPCVHLLGSGRYPDLSMLPPDVARYLVADLYGKAPVQSPVPAPAPGPGWLGPDQVQELVELALEVAMRRGPRPPRYGAQDPVLDVTAPRAVNFMLGSERRVLAEDVIKHFTGGLRVDPLRDAPEGEDET